MPQTSASLATKCLTMLVKDLKLELRDKYALNAVLMFGITTLAVVSFSLGQRNLPPHLLGALFWVIMFFSAMSGLAHIFIREEESGTSLALRLAAPPDAVYIGKLLFNLILLSVLTVIITPLFFIFTNAPVSSAIDFIPILILGVLGLFSNNIDCRNYCSCGCKRGSFCGIIFSNNYSFIINFSYLHPETI